MMGWKLKATLLGAAGVLLLLLTYSNHFRNGFHFDDAHTIVSNAYITDLKNHMHYEETVLFPKAVECLAKNDWDIVDNELRRIDDPLFGGSIGTEFRPLFEYFARRSDNLSRSVANFEFEQLDAMIVRADAIERFLVDMWKLSSMFAEESLSELRGALDRITAEPGARSLLATPTTLTVEATSGE